MHLEHCRGRVSTTLLSGVGEWATPDSLGCDDALMGMDVYVGPLTRYLLGEWLTVVQQTMQAADLAVQIVRSDPEPDDAITDPVVISSAVRSWQAGLLAALGGTGGWTENADLPYWTDKPDWDGYGGMLLLAAYDEQPELRPGNHRGLLRRRIGADSPLAFQDAPAFKRASVNPARYPTLLSGVEWWLPIQEGPTVFEAPRVTGQPIRMGRVSQLVSELDTLSNRLGLDSRERQSLRQAGPPSPTADAETAGRFGLAVFLALAHTAQQASQPLILDY